MRSRTSYFNRTLFLKTVTRFWPLWFIYFAVWFVAMPMVISSNLRWNGTRLAIQSDICTGATVLGIIFGMIFACVAVMAAWSFMYSARSTSGMACLPLRRECVFVSVSLGGFVPLLCVNVLIFLMCLGIRAHYGLVDAELLAQWLAAVSLELVFFYGFALVCAQLTGNLAVLPLVYLVLSLTVFVVENLFSSLATAFVYGVWITGTGRLSFLSPPVYMLTHVITSSEKVLVEGQKYYEVVSHGIEGWGVLLVYGAVGIALCALALWLYRRRRMESAGDVVAVGILRPVFKYCMTFGGALCIGMLLYSLTSGAGFSFSLRIMRFGPSFRGSGQWAELAIMTAYMLVGAFIGYFASEMLIHKSFRVWRGRWLGLGVSALIVAALMLSMELDLYGYERRVPDAGSVSSVYIMTGEDGVTLTAPENIAAAVELHRSVVENKRHYESFGRQARETTYENSDFAVGRRSISLYIKYELKDGGHLNRQYNGLYFLLDDESSQADARAAQNLLNTPEAIACRKATALEYTAETIFSADVVGRILPEDVEKAAESADVYDNGEKFEFSQSYVNLDGEALAVPADEKYGDDDISPYTAAWTLTPEQAAELYNQCILPDMADGTIGTVWLIADEEYKNTVYSMRIGIDARVLRGEGNAVYGTVSSVPEYRYEYFYTVPTVNSVRTNRWLEEHGIILRTISEAGEI